MESVIPIIETDRLILCGCSVEDFPAMLHIYQDDIAMRFVPPGVIGREACWSLWLQYHGMWATLGFGYWIIKLKPCNTIIGEIGFADFKRDTMPSMPDMLEIGTLLHSDFHGFGYGYEAKCAILDWQDKTLSRPVCCLVMPDNIVAIKQAIKSGFTFEKSIAYGDYQLRLGLREVIR